MVELVGKRVVPILVKDDGQPMLESMDMVAHIDVFGEPILVGPQRAELAVWASATADKTAPLTWPRYPLLGLAEFSTIAAHDHFVVRKQKRLGDLIELRARTRELIDALMPNLEKLDGMIESPGAVNGTLSLDDIRVLRLYAAAQFRKKCRQWFFHKIPLVSYGHAISGELCRGGRQRFDRRSRATAQPHPGRRRKTNTCTRGTDRRPAYRSLGQGRSFDRSGSGNSGSGAPFDLKMVATNGKPAGEFRLGALTTAVSELLPDLMIVWTQKYPQVELRMTRTTSSDLYQRVLDGDLDAAIMAEPPFAIPKTCDWRLLWEQPLVLLAPASASVRDPHRMLRTEPFIRNERTTWAGRLIDGYLRRAGIQPREQFELSGIDLIAALIDRGLGVSLMHDCGPFWLEGLSIAKIPLPHNPFARRIGLLWLRLVSAWCTLSAQKRLRYLREEIRPRQELSADIPAVGAEPTTRFRGALGW